MRSSLRFSKQCCSVPLTNRSPVKEAVSGRNGSRDSRLPDREEFQGMYCNRQMVQLSGGELLTRCFFVFVELEETHSAIFVNPILRKGSLKPNSKEFACKWKTWV